MGASAGTRLDYLVDQGDPLSLNFPVENPSKMLKMS